MKRAILLLIIAVGISGCGAFRKVFKLKESHRVEVVQERRADSVGITVDRSTVTVTERVDTIITTPSQVVTQEVELKMDSLINGMTAIKNDLIDVSLHLNPITGILSATATLKQQSVPVRIDRVTTKQNDITQSSQKQAAVLSRSKVEDKRSAVDKEPMKIPVWVIVIAIILVAGASWLFWRKR